MDYTYRNRSSFIEVGRKGMAKVFWYTIAIGTLVIFSGLLILIGWVADKYEEISGGGYHK